MSNLINALVITHYSHLLAAEIPPCMQDSQSEGLWYLRHTSEPASSIGMQEKEGLLAAEAFMNLGRIATSRYVEEKIDILPSDNPFKRVVEDVYQRLPPLQQGEQLPIKLAQPVSIDEYHERDLSRLFHMVDVYDKALSSEVREKWPIALGVLARRGDIVVNQYETQAVIDAIDSFDVNAHAPDYVEFDEDLQLKSESSSELDMVKDAVHHPFPVEKPYYQTFGQYNNEAFLLISALEDLRMIDHTFHEE